MLFAVYKNKVKFRLKKKPKISSKQNEYSSLPYDFQNKKGQEMKKPYIN